MSIYRVLHREQKEYRTFDSPAFAAGYISSFDYKGMLIVIKSDGYKGDRVITIPEKASVEVYASLLEKE